MKMNIFRHIVIDKPVSTIKKICILVLIFTFLLNMTSCKNSDDTNKEKQTVATVKVILPQGDNAYFNELYEQAVAEGEISEVENGISFDIITTESVDEQVDEINDAIDSVMDAIVIYPYESERINTAIQDAMDLGVPVVTFGDMVDGVKVNAAFYYDIKELSKDMLLPFKKCADESLEAIDSSVVNVVTFTDRDDLMLKYLSTEFNKNLDDRMSVVANFELSSRIKSMNEFQKWLDNSPEEIVRNVRAVYTQSDECSMGVLDAIQNYNGNIRLKIGLVTGIGGTKTLVENIESAWDDLGVNQITYNYSPVNIRYALRYAMNIINGTVERDYKGYEKKLQIVEVNRENVKKFTENNGYITRYSINQED